MAAILCKEEYRGLETKHVSFTFGGNVMAAAAAFKTLSIIEKPEFLANVKNKGAYILSRLHEMKQHYSFIGDCRGVGLMIGFELLDEEGNENIELTHKIIDLGFDNRLLLRSSRYGSGNVIKIRPSLNITSKESAIICDRLEKIFELIHKEKQY
jgi:4-aminobutyrate aminotransferase